MQNFIVLSHPDPVAQEAEHINDLFGAGMALFHLRKPGYNEQQLQGLLLQIRPEYYDRIALHQCHQLVQTSGIKRLHFPEKERLKQSEETLKALSGKGILLSTSIHEKTAYSQLSPDFTYTFYGPFAASISKPGYGDVPKNSTGIIKRNIALIALGGLHADNLPAPLTAGFDGVAVLGSIWKDKSVVDNFKQLQNIWTTADRQY